MGHFRIMSNNYQFIMILSCSTFVDGVDSWIINISLINKNFINLHVHDITINNNSVIITLAIAFAGSHISIRQMTLPGRRQRLDLAEVVLFPDETAFLGLSSRWKANFSF